MPGSATALRQERLKKTNARPVPLGLFTINEEDEQQKNGNSRRPKGMHTLWSEPDPAPAPVSHAANSAFYLRPSGAHCGMLVTS